MAELTGKAISELPAATTIGNNDLLALSQNGASKKVTPPVLLSVVESEISGLNSSLATYVRPNLLDNWYFVGGGSQGGDSRFPINQREQATYASGEYCVDRWKVQSGSVTLQDDGLQFVGATQLRQIFSSAKLITLTGKKATLTLLTNQGLCTATGTITTGTFCYTSISGVISANITYYNSQWNIIITSEATVKLQAVKLELGESQTLAHQVSSKWVVNAVPDFAGELAKCQRYFERIKGAYSHFGTGFANTATNVILYLPVKEKAKSPTVTLSGTIYIWQPGRVGDSSATCTSITSYNMENGKNMLYLTGPTSGVTLSAPCGAQFRDSTSYIDVFAE